MTLYKLGPSGGIRKIGSTKHADGQILLYLITVIVTVSMQGATLFEICLCT